ncbi:MAG: SusD/RagB family nutrient-binding outer membrane lipoprotein [Bacteroidota bacterium]|nr:MAG: SusD/RagB family nutrient-binding outer membrane lipoprotein [Bacteroidota bacterium]
MRTKYFALLVLTAVFVGCTDKFEEFNTDKKNPAIAAGNALFTNAQKELADQVNQTNVNQNVFKLWAQYWTETTYIDEANYDVVTRNIAEQIYRFMIREALRDFKEAKELIAVEEGPEAEATKQNRLMIIELLEAYTWHQLVDIFGMVPYTEALNIENVYPKYDDGAFIYNDLLKRVTDAVEALDPSEGSFGSADLYYGGDVEKWIKFGNSLKLKMGIILSDVNPTLAEQAITSALAGGIFESSADDALMPYLSSSPNQNPLYEEIVATGRNDYVVANTIVDIMNDLEDPRRQFFFTQKDGAYVGGIYGHSNSYPNYSHIHPDILAPDFHGFILTYTEMLFYLAEAAERGFAVPLTAEEYYNMGIKNSILEWGGTQDDVDTYLARPDVAYATAPDESEDGWRQKIATQAWIASYTRGLEGWTTWRRLDYPIFNIAEQIESVHDIPTRFTFPIEEQTLNQANYAAAVAALGEGGDKLTTKIFWDLYDANE